MFVIRNVFRCKPGQAKKVIEKFQAAMPIMQDIARQRLLVDEVANFWTVVVEVEAEDLGTFEKLLQERSQRQDLKDAMSGYMDSIESGYREIFRIVQ